MAKSGSILAATLASPKRYPLREFNTAVKKRERKVLAEVDTAFSDAAELNFVQNVTVVVLEV